MIQDEIDLVPPVGGSETILIVHNDAATRERACRMLERGGYDVLQACDGSSAVALLAHHDSAIALLITEMALPGMPAPELIRWARGLVRKIRVIAIVQADDEELRHCERLRDVLLLARPFTTDQLARSIRIALDRD